MAAPLRIGQAAAAAGVSARTLRYYEQLGLLAPSERSGGGERRYGEDDVARLHRIRQLADLLGSDLEEIRRVLVAEDRLAELRAQWHQPGQDPRRQAAILAEATRLNAELQARVVARLERLSGLLADLRARAARYDDLRAGRPRLAVADPRGG